MPDMHVPDACLQQGNRLKSGSGSYSPHLFSQPNPAAITQPCIVDSRDTLQTAVPAVQAHQHSTFEFLLVIQTR
jgi:hypothetical protein